MATNQLGSINHVVQLMLENRSFDHMLGYLYNGSGNVSPATGQAFDGLTGSESVPDGDGNAVTVAALRAGAPELYFMPGADPGEGFTATNLQLFGTASPSSGAAPTNAGFVTDYATTLAGVDADRQVLPGTTADWIMNVYAPELLPVLSGLARGFAVCDAWFASVPTETIPNRAFACAATSQGRLSDDGPSFSCPTIFGLLDQHGVSWSIYGYDEQPLTRLDFPDTLAADESHFGVFSDFTAAAAAGTLGAYTFLEPSWGSSGNSQHPNYDVALGEQLIHDVYEAVRSGPGWAETLLVITYDEHGGCYDHVPPPSGATPPGDGSTGDDGFDFGRYGVRVPAVLVSPLIPAGTVFRATGTAPLDHTSVLKTVETRFGLPSLTARDAAAPDLGDVLTLAPSAARTDDPLAGVTVPVSPVNPVAGRPSHLQRVFARLVADLPVPGEAEPSGGIAGPQPLLASESDYSAYIARRYGAWRASHSR